MVVKKKPQPQASNRDMMDLSRGLARVKEAITHLPTDEGAVMNEAAQQPAGSTVKKKAAKSTTVKKKAAPVEVSKTTLAEVCKPMKLAPRAGRRILRNAKVKNPGRWAWPKGSAELKKAQKVLADSQK